MIDLLKAVVLGIIQGLTEFLPISSSAHLRIFPELFGWGDPGAAFTAVIQIGTELAVLIYFRKDIWRIGVAWVRSLFQAEYRGTLDSRMGWYIIVGSLPIVVLGAEEGAHPCVADAPDVLAEVDQHGELGADLDDGRERGSWVAPPEELGDDPQVRAARDRQELGEPLDDAEHDGFEEIDHRG